MENIKMSKHLRYVINGGLVITAVVSTLYLLMLGYYALPTADDWWWTNLVEEMNPFGFVKHFYLVWQGRYSALLVDGALCRYLGRSEHLLGFTIVELLLGYGAIYLLLRDLLKLPDSGILAAIVVIITNLGVMAFPEIGTFYWLCTTNYIHEIWFTIYLIWFVFYCRYSWLQWMGTILCAIYLGGSAENYPPVLALALGCVWLWRMIKYRAWNFWQYHNEMLLLVATLLIGIGFLVMLFAPGNDVRLAAEGANSLIGNFSLSIFIVNTFKASFVLLLRLLSRGWYLGCVFPLFLFLGVQVQKELPRLTWQRVLISLTIAVGIIVISVAASVYGVGWYATMRANCFIVFIAMAWVGYIGVLFGNRLTHRVQIISSAVIIASLAISITSIVYIATEGPIVRKYNREVVSIHHQMQQYVADGRTELVRVKPVCIAYRQSSYGYLRNALQVIFHKSKRYQECYFPYEPFRLENDPSDWRNQFYKAWLKAQFDIVYADEKLE